MTSSRSWLIENDVDGPRYWTPIGKYFYWVKDANQAVRFARKEDAEVVAGNLLNGKHLKVTEHMWID